MITLNNWNELIQAIETLENLEELRQNFLGKKGLLTQEMKSLSNIQSIEEKKEKGQQLNIIREHFQNAFNEKKDILEQKILHQKLEEEFIDLTLPARPQNIGKKHILSVVRDDILDYFERMGFTLQVAPDIDTEENNFDALNIPTTHPARQSQDTFYLEQPQTENRTLLRTHTSNTQIHTMKSKTPPFRCMSLGRCYRSDDIDATHTPMFHQFEIFAVDNSITMAHLKTTIIDFLRYFFNNDKLEIRFRPSFFPFTTPSAEVDVMMHGKGWLEILGCGLIHPNVLNNCSIDHKQFTGFAAGMGIERLTMLKYNIQDIRFLYENDQRFLKAFGS